MELWEDPHLSRSLVGKSVNGWGDSDYRSHYVQEFMIFLVIISNCWTNWEWRHLNGDKILPFKKTASITDKYGNGEGGFCLLHGEIHKTHLTIRQIHIPSHWRIGLLHGVRCPYSTVIESLLRQNRKCALCTFYLKGRKREKWPTCAFLIFPSNFTPLPPWWAGAGWECYRSAGPAT